MLSYFRTAATCTAAPRRPSACGLLAFAAAAFGSATVFGQAAPVASAADAAVPAADAVAPPAAPPDADETPAADKPAPGPALPAGFQPPRSVPEVFKIKKPVMTAEQIETELKELKKAQVGRALTAGVLNNETRDLLTRWAKLQFARMAGEADPKKIGEITREMRRDIVTAGALQENQNRLREFREHLASEIVKAASGVLDNNFYVRFQAVLIMARLNLLEETFRGARAPEIGYTPALTPLLDVLADPQQHVGLKVVAAEGIKRIAATAETVPAEVRFRAAQVLTDELAKTDTHYWYQMRLAEAIGFLGLDYDRNRKPVLVNALLATVADEKRQFVVRAAAARALGHVPMPAEIDSKLVASRLVQLGQSMALAYNKSPSRPQWKQCFADLLLAFVPLNDEEKAKLPNNSIVGKGNLSGPLDDAYQRLLPLVKHVLSQPERGAQPLSAEQVQKLNEYLANNRP